MLSLGIKCFMRDLISDVSYCAWAKSCDMRHLLRHRDITNSAAATELVVPLTNRRSFFVAVRRFDRLWIETRRHLNL